MGSENYGSNAWNAHVSSWKKATQRVTPILAKQAKNDPNKGRKK